MSDITTLRAEIRKLALHLQESAHRHGEVDAYCFWSPQMYRDACVQSNAALTALLNRIDAVLNLRPQAAQDVLAERRRQIEVEGWTPEHDDEHSESELALAAASYAAAAGGYAKGKAPPIWPFALDWWKPSYGRRDLVKAAALLLAEIERIDRAAAEKGEQ